MENPPKKAGCNLVCKRLIPVLDVNMYICIIYDIYMSIHCQRFLKSGGYQGMLGNRLSPGAPGAPGTGPPSMPAMPSMPSPLGAAPQAMGQPPATPGQVPVPVVCLPEKSQEISSFISWPCQFEYLKQC